MPPLQRSTSSTPLKAELSRSDPSRVAMENDERYRLISGLSLILGVDRATRRRDNARAATTIFFEPCSIDQKEMLRTSHMEFPDDNKTKIALLPSPLLKTPLPRSSRTMRSAVPRRIQKVYTSISRCLARMVLQ